MEIRVKEKNGDQWFEIVDNNEILRAILFSREAQDDIEPTIHADVIKKITDTLNLDTNGPTLKVKPDSSGKTFTLIHL